MHPLTTGSQETRSPKKGPIIRAQNIHRSFMMGETQIQVLQNVDLAIAPGEFVAIEGRSGSGKSTLLQLMGALDGVDKGSLHFDGEDYTFLTFAARKSRWPRWIAATHTFLDRIRGGFGEFKLRYQLLIAAGVILLNWIYIETRYPALFDFGAPKTYLIVALSLLLSLFVVMGIQVNLWLLTSIAAFLGWSSELFTGTSQGRKEKRAAFIRNREFGFVFQFYHLLPELDVLENTMLSQMVRFSTFRYLIQRRALRKRAIELLTQLGMSHRLTHRPNQLSGGERQRVAIARALMNKPRVLFADEPTGNLDAETGRQIMDLLEKLHRDENQTIVMVTHDRALAREADRVLVLKEGKLVKTE